MPLDSLDKLPRAAEQVTLAEAYRAMLRVMEYYDRVGGPYRNIGTILCDLSTGVDGSFGDPAAWDIWLDAVDEKMQGGAAGA